MNQLKNIPTKLLQELITVSELADNSLRDPDIVHDLLHTPLDSSGFVNKVFEENLEQEPIQEENKLQIPLIVIDSPVEDEQSIKEEEPVARIHIEEHEEEPRTIEMAAFSVNEFLKIIPKFSGKITKTERFISCVEMYFSTLNDATNKQVMNFIHAKLSGIALTFYQANTIFYYFENNVSICNFRIY